MWLDQGNGICLGLVLALKLLAINVDQPLSKLLGMSLRVSQVQAMVLFYKVKKTSSIAWIIFYRE